MILCVIGAAILVALATAPQRIPDAQPVVVDPPCVVRAHHDCTIRTMGEDGNEYDAVVHFSAMGVVWVEQPTLAPPQPYHLVKEK